jgi:hypothetical protein
VELIVRPDVLVIDREFVSRCLCRRSTGDDLLAPVFRSLLRTFLLANHSKVRIPLLASLHDLRI